MPNIEQGPEFPCDADLEPYVTAGKIDAWQAMQTTTCRAAAKAVAELQALQKKMDELQQQDKPALPSKWTPTPRYT
jgi:hypothetical protein